MRLYCALCGSALTMTEVEDGGGIEHEGVCPNGHKWLFAAEYLRRGDFMVWQVEGFQCDQGEPYPEVAAAFS